MRDSIALILQARSNSRSQASRDQSERFCGCLRGAEIQLEGPVAIDVTRYTVTIGIRLLAHPATGVHKHARSGTGDSLRIYLCQLLLSLQEGNRADPNRVPAHGSCDRCSVDGLFARIPDKIRRLGVSGRIELKPKTIRQHQNE